MTSPTRSGSSHHSIPPPLTLPPFSFTFPLVVPFVSLPLCPFMFLCTAQRTQHKYSSSQRDSNLWFQQPRCHRDRQLRLGKWHVFSAVTLARQHGMAGWKVDISESLSALLLRFVFIPLCRHYSPSETVHLLFCTSAWRGPPFWCTSIVQCNLSVPE
jgi:hypothetical protein